MRHAGKLTMDRGHYILNSPGFSLIETMAAVTITSLIVVAVISVYSRIRNVSASVERRLDATMPATEILQRIAQDIDRLTLPGLETTISIANKSNGQFNLSRMEIVTRFYDGREPPVPQVYERIVWQSDYDRIANAIILYRSHSGLNLEDKLVDKDLQAMQQGGRDIFIPVATGITFFEILGSQGENEFREWRLTGLPRAVRTRISFAQPQQDFQTGQWMVFDEDKMERIVAIDRTRKLRYNFVPTTFEMSDPTSTDEPNSAADAEGLPPDDGTGQPDRPLDEGPGPEAPAPVTTRPLPGRSQ